MQQYFPPAPPRPMGVTILAVLAAIGGIFALLGTVCGFAAIFILPFFGILVSLILLVSGVLNLVFAYGAWYLKPWGWTLGIAAEGLAVLSSLFNWILGYSNFGNFLVSLIIAGVIVYYLMTPEVKRAFGRA